MDNRIVEAASNIKEYCERNSNETMVIKYSRYFTEGYDAYGLDTDKWQELKRNTIKEYAKGFDLDDFVELSKYLVENGRYEEVTLGICLLEHFKKDLNSYHLAVIEEWFETGIKNWAQTDILCRDLLSYLLKEGIVELKDILPWVFSEKKWKKRAAPVSFFYILQDDTNINELLDAVRPLMSAADKPVQQGTGWFLREAHKKFPDEVEEFLFEYKDTAPRLIYQYAMEKMKPEQKLKFKKIKNKN